MKWQYGPGSDIKKLLEFKMSVTSGSDVNVGTLIIGWRAGDNI